VNELEMDISVLLGYFNLSQHICIKHFLFCVLISFSLYRCPVKSKSVQSVFHVLLLRNENFVFGPKYSTAMQLNCLHERESRNISDKKPTVAVFLNVATDFETVCVDSLLYKLRVITYHSYLLHRTEVFFRM